MFNNRVIIRPLEKKDAEELAFVANNKKIWNNLRDSIPSPYSIEDANQWIANVNKDGPATSFAIVREGNVVGTVGCILGKDNSRKTIEIGYFVGESFWGKGIATEAVKHLLQYIIQTFDCIRVEAHVFAQNKSSMKVLEKNGFYLEALRKRAVIKNNEVIDDCVWVKLL
jgi:ribosomal-protein-alanine N-acetyltransferase